MKKLKYVIIEYMSIPQEVLSEHIILTYMSDF